jgi:23S rRNA-/tRNA-specific pseudouridylate synthase
VLGGEIVKLKIKQEKTNDWVAQDIPIDIIFEDEDIIIINKHYFQVNMITKSGLKYDLYSSYAH